MPTRWKRWMLMTLLALSAGPMTGCSKDMVLISRDQEIQMGEEAAPQFEEEFGGAVQDQTLQNYVSRIGRSVAEVSNRDMPYEFTLVRSETPNAFALPGGKIFLTAGLMNVMNNERELAAVLAHEVAHVSEKHNVRQMQQQLGWQVMAEILAELGGEGTGQAASVATQIVGGMTSLKYSRTYEHDADENGIIFLERARYNPWGMVELLTVLKNLHEREPSSLENMFQTHPLTSERIDESARFIQENYPSYSQTSPDPDRARFQEMRTRLRKVMMW